MESSNDKFVCDLYNKEDGGTLVPNKAISNPKGRPARLSKFDEDSSTKRVPQQLMNWSKENRAYKDLIVNFEINSSDVRSQVREEQMVEKLVPAQVNSWLYCRNISFETKADVVGQFKFSSRSYKSIAWRLKLDIAQVKCILKHFDLSLKQHLDLRRLEIIKHLRILGDDQISWLKDYLSSRRNKRVVAEQVMIELGSKFPEIGTISVSTLRRILKRELWYSYKKLNRRTAVSNSQTNIQHFLTSLEILKALKDDGWELIYFDGFGYDPRKQEFYGGAWREAKATSKYMKILLTWPSSLQFQGCVFMGWWASLVPQQVIV